jgi:hypothetical protein
MCGIPGKQRWLDNQPLFISGSVKAVIEQVAADNVAGVTGK